MTAEKTDASATPDYYGHRKRLRERFMRDEGASMSDYELLELLLTLVIPRRDVKPIAKRLLLKFENFPSVIFAEQHDLKEKGCLSDSSIFMMKCIATCVIRSVGYNLMEKKDAKMLENMGTLKNYCRITMGYRETEEFRAFFYDNSFRFKGTTVLSSGLSNQTSVHIRSLAQEALRLNSTVVILAHNHPSGTCFPSKEDIYATQMLCQQAEVYGITIWEHLIVTKAETYSLRESGYIGSNPNLILQEENLSAKNSSTAAKTSKRTNKK